MNFYIVLFKDKTKKKIIKKFSNSKKAEDFYNEMLKENKSVIFEKLFDNGKPSKYDIGLLSDEKPKSNQIYIQDEIGRNIKVTFEDDSFTAIKISPYKVEETIFDISNNKKISITDFVSLLKKDDSLKVIYPLNNKIILQNDDNLKLFSLKSEGECMRFIECLSEHIYTQKRKDCMFVNDTSKPQKKYLIKLLSEYGFDKKMLYRKHTTYPRST
jgi:hypothetical protein